MEYINAGKGLNHDHHARTSGIQTGLQGLTIDGKGWTGQAGPRPFLCHWESGQEPLFISVKVNGKPITVLLGSGSSISFIKACHVPCPVDFSQHTIVQCVHGNCKQDPQVELTVEVDDQKYLLNVGVLKNLPVEMLLGRGLPVLCELLGRGRSQLYCNLVRFQYSGLMFCNDLCSSKNQSAIWFATSA